MDDIIIDLKNYANNPNLKANTLIHKASNEKLKNIINGMIPVKSGDKNDTVSNFPLEKQLNTKRVTNTIFINGKRGAGKTTFLKSILADYLNSAPSSSAKIIPLAFIDPTLIDTQQHLLVDIIVKIDMAVESQFKNCCDDKNRKEYREKLKGMSEGLKLLKNYHSHQPTDAQWFLSQALKESHHGQKLEEQFHEYIDVVKKMLGADFLIIAIDDVDTETQAAYEVLEIIRSYITHPDVAVIITGDEELYNFIVHGKKLETLGNITKKHNKAFHAQQKELAKHLTQQYLLKILPPHQRIELQDIYTLLHKDKAMKIIVSYDEEQEIREFWQEVVKSGLFIVNKEVPRFVNFILKQPIRSNIHLASTLYRQGFFEKYDSHLLVSAISSIFHTELFLENINLSELTHVDIEANTIAKTMLKLYEKNGNLETGFYARPNGQVTSFDTVQIFLSSVITHYINKTPYATINNKTVLGSMLELMLTADAACTIFAVFYQVHFSSNSRKYINLVDYYINYIGLQNNANVYSICSHYSPVVLDNIVRGRSPILFIASGIIRLKRDLASSSKSRIKVLRPKYFKKAEENIWLEVARLDTTKISELFEAEGSIKNIEKLIDKIPNHLNENWKNVINVVINHIVEMLTLKLDEPFYNDNGKKTIERIKNDSLKTQVEKHLKNNEHDFNKLAIESELGELYQIYNNAIDKSGSLSRLYRTIEFLIQSNSTNLSINLLPSIFSGISVLASGHSIARSTGTNDYVSSYSLLAFVSELLKAPNREALEGILYQRLEIPTFAPPILEDMIISEINEVNDSIESINETQEEYEAVFKPMIDIIIEWKEFANNQIEGVSSILQGKIWTRIFYSLNRSSESLRQKNTFFKIDSKNKTRDVYLHEVLCISMISIINACLIEEVRYSLHNSFSQNDKKILESLITGLSNAENAITSVDKLEKNLAIVKNILLEKKPGRKSLLTSGFERFVDFFPLTASLITCPLIMPFFIYPLGDFDNVANLKWGSNKNYTNVHLLVKSLLKDKSKLWKETFLDSTNSFIDIDMRYISVIPITSTN